MEKPLDIFDISSGVCSKCLRYICHKLDISMYAFDFNEECIIKNISVNRNKKALMFYSIDNHMYLISDDKLRKKLYEKVKNCEITSSLIKDNKKEITNIYSLYDIIDNVDLNSLPKTLRLYRIVCSDDIVNINKEYVGSHYSLNKNNLVKNHYGRGSIQGSCMGDKVFLVTVDVDKTNMDVLETLSNNILFPHEEEITLKNKGLGSKIINLEEL
jgi:hypothetical protein